MNKITYRPATIFRQIFFIMIFLYILLRFLVMAEIVMFKVPKYYDNLNIPLTIVLYVILFTISIYCIRMPRLFNIEYNEHKVVYNNLFTKKSTTVNLDEVGFAHLSKKGIHLYSSEDHKRLGKEPLITLPFMRFGIIDAIGINDFFRLLKSKGDIGIQKDFKVLPGYEKKWKIVPWLYGLGSVIVFGQWAMPIKVLIVLWQSH